MTIRLALSDGVFADPETVVIGRRVVNEDGTAVVIGRLATDADIVWE